VVVGNGMLANVFHEYQFNENKLIYASGVSSSLEDSDIEFNREKKLLKKMLLENETKQFIYFSSCSLEDISLRETPYHIHKLNMEKLIKRNSNNYLIFRIPNIIGKYGNDNNIINFLINKVENDLRFSIWKNATRNIVDIDDLYKIVSYILNNTKLTNQVINIAYNESIKIFDLIKAIEEFLNKKAVFDIEDKGIDMKIENHIIKKVMLELDIETPNTLELIKKHKG